MKKLFVSSVCLLIAGWGLKLLPVSVKAETPSVVKQSNISTKIALDVVPPQVELLNAGAEPRQQLRFKPAVNSRETTDITINMNILAISVNGKSLPNVQMPTITLKMETVITQVDSNGDIHYQFSYTNADVVTDSTTPPQLVATLRPQLKKIVGLRGSGIVDNRGQIKAYNLVFPETLDQSTKQLLKQMSNSVEQTSAPVPEQPVGIGAEWRVSSSPNQSQISFTQLSTYQLVGLQNHVATIRFTQEQHATAPNSTLKLLDSQGQGQVTADLNRLMALDSTTSVRSNSENSTNSGNQTSTVNTQLLTEIVLKSQ